jgi:hypothetical protein
MVDHQKRSFLGVAKDKYIGYWWAGVIGRVVFISKSVLACDVVA